jgi:hypothetical protein
MPSTDFVDEPYVNYVEEEDGDEEIFDIYNTPLEYHDWITWYNNDLMNMWMGVKMYLRDSYLEKPLMGDMDFDDFCSFFYQFSTKMSSRRAT